MSSGKKYLKALSNVLFYLVCLILLITVVPKILVFFLPFIIGWIISAIANPAVRFLEEKIKFKRKTTSAIAIILILAIVISIVYGIGYFLITQGIGFFTSIPKMWPSLEKDLDEFGDKINNIFRYLPDSAVSSINNFGNTLEKYVSDLVSGLGTPTINAVSNVAKGLPSVIISVIMCVLSAYFFTTDRNTLLEKAQKFIPKVAYDKLEVVVRGMKKAVGGYFVAQFKIEIWIYLITFIGLMILRIDFAAIIALGIAVLDLLPFFGAGLIMVPWAIISFVNGDYFVAAGLLVVWGIGQIFRQIIQPKIVGDQVGLNPLPTLFLLFIGFEFGSMFGMIIAVPIGIIVVSLYEEGLFRGLLDSIKVLWDGMSRFRHFTPEEMAQITGKDEKEETRDNGEAIKGDTENKDA